MFLADQEPVKCQKSLAFYWTYVAYCLYTSCFICYFQYVLESFERENVKQLHSWGGGGDKAKGHACL